MCILFSLFVNNQKSIINMCMNPKYVNKQLKNITKVHSTMFCRFE